MEILDRALELEKNVNSVLLILLNIEIEQRKAITNKSGNLSFKNKIDLLYDLSILNSEEHKSLNLFMEFRNQFMHNIECTSFEKAVSLLGSDKGNKLAAFYTENENREKEEIYRFVYKKLYIKTIEIILDKYDRRKKDIEEKRKAIQILNSNSIHLSNSITGLVLKMIEKFSPNESDQPEIIDIKMQILNTLTEESRLIKNSEDYHNLVNSPIDPQFSDKIKILFK